MKVDFDKKFMLQRIAYQGIISYNLIESGYLVYGWSDLLLDAYNKNKYILQGIKLNELEKIGISFYGDEFTKYRNRHNIIKFFNYNVGDYVLIPKYKSFGVYQIADKPQSIYECDYINDVIKVKTYDNRNVTFDKTKGIVIDGDSKQIDIGMIVKVKEIYRDISKDYAPAELQSKFKYYGAFLDLTNNKDIIKRTIENYESEKPISFYNSVIENLKNNNWYSELNNHKKLEYLVKNLFIRLGADESKVLSTNEPGKENNADCDVKAVFNNLGIQYMVQCKHHDNKEEDETWAIEQITRYAEQKAESMQEGTTTILWVVSMAESFSLKTNIIATEKGVRLINQKDLIKLLINSGWTSEMEEEDK